MMDQVGSSFGGPQTIVVSKILFTPSSSELIFAPLGGRVSPVENACLNILILPKGPLDG